MRDDLMRRLQRALSSVQRRADKLRTRAQQQRIAASKAAVQRQEKQKQVVQKLAAECQQKLIGTIEGVQVSFHSESENWVSQLLDRMKIGKERFNEYIEVFESLFSNLHQVYSRIVVI
jgi:Mg2+ and Co2+ transporter CorA